MGSFSLDLSDCMAPRFSLSPRRSRFNGGCDDSDSDSDTGLWTVRRRNRCVPRKSSLRTATRSASAPAAKDAETAHPRGAEWAPLPKALAGDDTLHYKPVPAPLWNGSMAPPSVKSAKISPGEAARRVAAKFAARDARDGLLLTSPCPDEHGRYSSAEESPVPSHWTGRSSAFIQVPAKQRSDSCETVKKSAADQEPTTDEDRQGPAPRKGARSYFYALGEDVHAVLALMM
eukprot:TRINITY_DN50461_c0_g1_i1.p1 TRINITY_DN50461_c0_g1~~TRINITY_DN50461_c0_g1_i1.p1  ORF type:complete len:260 (+),score=59.28 TRINITY_DN50461_c0_g1_i1:88-780(+)